MFQDTLAHTRRNLESAPISEEAIHLTPVFSVDLYIIIKFIMKFTKNIFISQTQPLSLGIMQYWRQYQNYYNIWNECLGELSTQEGSYLQKVMSLPSHINKT